MYTASLVRWELKLAETDNSMSEMLLMQKRDANSNFCKFVKRNYEDWVTGSEHPLMSHEIFRQRVFPLLDKGEKTCFILVDNFRLDQWKVVLPLVSEFFNVSEELYTTILPTSTQYARNAIFAGLMPLQIATMFPQYWVDEDEDEGLNIHEEKPGADPTRPFSPKGQIPVYKTQRFIGRREIRSVALLLQRHTVAGSCSQLHRHAFTCAHRIKDDTRALQTATPRIGRLRRAWFRHSSAVDIFRRLAELGYKVILTTTTARYG